MGAWTARQDDFQKYPPTWSYSTIFIHTHTHIYTCMCMHISAHLYTPTYTCILLSATAGLCMLFFWQIPRTTSFRTALLQFNSKYLGERCGTGNSPMDTKLICQLRPKYRSTLSTESDQQSQKKQAGNANRHENLAMQAFLLDVCMQT